MSKRGIFGQGYDTQLQPQDEARFRQWAGPRIRDTEDYDLRGAYNSGWRPKSPDEHGPDTFKKPNHPTFSDGSQYSTPQNPGGKWVKDGRGGWVFWASPANLQHQTASALSRYFTEREPGNNVIMPFNYGLPPR